MVYQHGLMKLQKGSSGQEDGTYLHYPPVQCPHDGKSLPSGAIYEKEGSLHEQEGGYCGLQKFSP